MTTFLMGLLIGMVIARAFDLWVNFKYEKSFTLKTKED